MVVVIPVVPQRLVTMVWKTTEIPWLQFLDKVQVSLVQGLEETVVLLQFQLAEKIVMIPVVPTLSFTYPLCATTGSVGFGVLKTVDFLQFQPINKVVNIPVVTQMLFFTVQPVTRPLRFSSCSWTRWLMSLLCRSHELHRSSSLQSSRRCCSPWSRPFN